MAVLGSTEKALVAWINSLPVSLGIPPISSLSDVADGISLSKILLDVDKEYFESSAIELASVGEERPSFIATVRNLKRLYKALSTYYTDTLHLGALDNISSPNVSLVAKDGSIQEAVKLVHLVLLVSVNSDTKTSEYMDCIQRISDVDARNILLELIEECKQRVDDKKSGIVAEYDMDARIQSEVSNVLARYEHLERAYAELEEHNSVLQDNYEKMKGENAKLHEQVSQAGGMSKLQVEIAENKAKSQIEYLQKEMQDLEEQLVVKDKKLSGSEMKTKELVMQVRSSG
ncbi:hypothetical protein V1527DRAFT_411549 [Lipomyces starkeyi]